MDSTVHQISRSAYAVIGPEDATNFTIVKGNDGSAVLVDADIRRIDEVAKHMLAGGYAAFGKSRMVERNINHFLTGQWY